ncbi:AMP-binding protein [Myxococcus sp. AM010]|uniref:AMP-binding protein n=1 Tax=Myxococcus sp. AM010 TaxID=2745138 RepID=UPI00159513A4|nr:AMP-binding protein [Myxococcus sp. AM010]NVJ15830.1 AMP-binding protein [Myxococcus sp. AM010]
MSFETLQDLLSHRARTQPDREVFSFLDGRGEQVASLTYGALHQRAAAIAAALRPGMKPGDTALLLYPSGLEFIAGFFGVLLAGGIPVPLCPPRGKSDVRRVATTRANARAQVVLTSSELLPLLRPMSGLPDWASVQWVASDTHTAAAPQGELPPARRHDTAYLQYTSGSTAAPKGVMISHRNALFNATDIQQSLGLTEASVVVSWLPMFHDFGMVFTLFAVLTSGARAVLLAPESFIKDPLTWLRALTEHRATHTGSPNFGYQRCVTHVAPEHRKDLDLSALRCAVSGSEPIRYETLRAFADAYQGVGFSYDVFDCGFGLAESTLRVTTGQRSRVLALHRDALERGTVTPVEETSPHCRLLVSCGKTAHGEGQHEMRLEIVDPGTRLPCPPGKLGHVWVAGPSVSPGYYENAEATRATFHNLLTGGDGTRFLDTGDLGFLDHGELFITGRAKELIIIRGENHYPQDLESTAVAAMPRLRDDSTVALGTEGETEDSIVLLAEAPDDASGEDVAALAGPVARAISESHGLSLSRFVLVARRGLPRTTSGKLQRLQSKEAWLRGDLSVLATWENARGDDETAPTVAPELDGLHWRAIEAWGRAWLARQLRLPDAHVTAQAPFTHLGLSSVDALAFSGALERLLGRKVPATTFFDHPTLRELAQSLQPAAEDVASPAAPTDALSELEQELQRAEQRIKH